ncbi:hypothetical protein FT641_19045 [Bacillus paranthracis]|uniref:hypothetical protein n=1 Tax=Bacillus paranthracis TaxID=2026186 RepID=UPI00187A2F94|nr:hypothetical protein [Bacillus paranthracis]MBE7114337.1 hypothetical protein [Bacillus paranthracis]MBE7154790.1 hypothetical protein [Bacillus paranthracis]
MVKKFDFRKGDIISYAGETFEVLAVNSSNDGGKVAYWHNGVRGEVVTENWYWSAYGEDCQLVKRAG